MRKTKIICTLGPATDEAGVLEKLIKSGMNVARMNFSHGEHKDHKKRIDKIKESREKIGIPLAIMLDTKGPEVRIGTFKNKKVFLRPDQKFVLTTENIEGDENIVTVKYKDLPKSLEKGQRVLFSDGLIASEVIDVNEKEITLIIKNGGYLSDRKSINLPDTTLDMPYMNDTDMEDIRFGIENDVDYIAASFVRSAEDVRSLKKFIKSVDKNSKVRIISKIESEDGVKNIVEIIDESDGVMIARGDMGVEIEMERLPEIQKQIIKKCLGRGKISITATQMLESMIENPRPTRAEVTDIANAIYDGTSAIMLSGETAAGKYPAESVATMAKIAKTTENAINYQKRFLSAKFSKASVTKAISHATITTATDLDAKAVVAVTQSGHTAYSVSGSRPYCQVIAVTPHEKVFHQLALAWGIEPVLCPHMNSAEDMFLKAISLILEKGYVKNGGMVVATGNNTPSESGTTNVLRVHTINL